MNFSSDMVTVKVVLAMVGKFGITASYGVIYLMTVELFPTVIRYCIVFLYMYVYIMHDIVSIITVWNETLNSMFVFFFVFLFCFFHFLFFCNDWSLHQKQILPTDIFKSTLIFAHYLWCSLFFNLFFSRDDPLAVIDGFFNLIIFSWDYWGKNKNK